MVLTIRIKLHNFREMDYPVRVWPKYLCSGSFVRWEKAAEYKGRDLFQYRTHHRPVSTVTRGAVCATQWVLSTYTATEHHYRWFGQGYRRKTAYEFE